MYVFIVAVKIPVVYLPLPEEQNTAQLQITTT